MHPHVRKVVAEAPSHVLPQARFQRCARAGKDMGYTGWMPWKETNAMEQRVEIIGKYLAREESVSELAREYGLSRKTVYKWIERFERGGVGGLEELSRAPHHHPSAISEAVERHTHDAAPARAVGEPRFRSLVEQLPLSVYIDRLDELLALLARRSVRAGLLSDYPASLKIVCGWDPNAVRSVAESPISSGASSSRWPPVPSAM